MEIINLIYLNQATIIIFFGILGLLVGSFINVVIYRLPIKLKNEYKKNCLEYFKQEPEIEGADFDISSPRSLCPLCKKIIIWWQNIPIVSFLILKGKCHNCENKIPWRYPLVEALSAITTIIIALHFGDAYIKTFSTLILTWGLIAATFIDFEHQLLPDNITLPLIWLGLLININHTFATPQDAIIGAIFGYTLLWTVAKIFKLVRKIEGMGHGDFKLLAIFGAWLGWQIIPFIIFTASVAGVIVGIVWISTKKYFFTRPIPFGPYIAIAGWLAFFWGQNILKWYISFH